MGPQLNTRWKKRIVLWISMVMSAAMIILAGCEPISGVNVEKWMVQNSAVSSYEAKGSVSLKVETAESASLNEEKQEVLELLDGMELRLEHVKMEDPYTISVDGEWVSGSLHLPIRMTADQAGTVLKLDGVSKPIYISAALPAEIPAELGLLQQQFASDYAELVRLVSAFAFQHLPNPSQVKVDRDTETIQGEAVDLTRVHSVLKGSDLLPMLTVFLQNAAEDEAGLKQIIGDLYDHLAPLFSEMMNINGPEQAFAIPDKTIAVDLLYSAIQAELPAIIEQWGSLVEQAEQNESVMAVLENSTVSLELYFDHKGYIRKQSFEMTISPQLDTTEHFIQSIQIRGEMEYWNIDEPVNASNLDVSSDALRFEGPLEPSAADFFKHVDPNSALYELAAMFDLNRTELFLMPFPAHEKIMAAQWNEPFVEHGVTYVPIRYVAENLGADVRWDRANQQVLILDSLTNKEIILKINSNHAWIDGMKTALPANTELHLVGDKIYVPIKWLVQELGGFTKWQRQADIVIVERVY